MKGKRPRHEDGTCGYDGSYDGKPPCPGDPGLAEVTEPSSSDAPDSQVWR